MPHIIEAICNSISQLRSKYLSSSICYNSIFYGIGFAFLFSIVSDILLCTQNQLLIKGLYGMLRDEGYNVGLSDFPAHAVQQVLNNSYDAVIFDSQAFGMSAEDAVKVIKMIKPQLRVILVGNPEEETDAFSIREPIDLERLRNLIHCIHAGSITLYR